MQPVKIIEELKRAVLEVKEKKQEMVSVEALLNYFDALGKDIKTNHQFDQRKFESDIAMFRAEHERNLAHYDAQQQHSLEMFRSVISYGQAALKSAILINGGAAVALLALIGNIWAKGIASAAVGSLTRAILLFSFGVLSAAFGTGTTYLTQYCYSESWVKTAKVFHVIIITIVLISYFLFGKGAYESFLTFAQHLSK